MSDAVCGAPMGVRLPVTRAYTPGPVIVTIQVCPDVVRVWRGLDVCGEFRPIPVLIWLGWPNAGDLTSGDVALRWVGADPARRIVAVPGAEAEITDDAARLLLDQL